LLSNILNSPYMPVITVVLLAIIICCGAIFFKQKYGIKIITTAESIVKFVRDALIMLNLDTPTIQVVIDLMLEAITLALNVVGAETIEMRVAQAMDYVEMKIEPEYPLTVGQISIIKQAFMFTFIFMDSLNIKPNQLKLNNLTNAMLKTV